MTLLPYKRPTQQERPAEVEKHLCGSAIKVYALQREYTIEIPLKVCKGFATVLEADKKLASKAWQKKHDDYQTLFEPVLRRLKMPPNKEAAKLCKDAARAAAERASCV